jgi:Holliday junction DNA helicase RuvA
MIAKLTGRLESVGEGSVLLEVGEVTYEVLVPAIDLAPLRRDVGQRVVLHTLQTIEGNPAMGGALTPRLVGFLSATEKAFFRRFTTVKGIGVRKALRALTEPIGRIAAAIEGRDVKFLTTLPEVGKRTAEQIVAELQGKLEAFAQVPVAAQGAAEVAPFKQEAIAVMVGQLGERRNEAERWIEQACAADESIDTAEALIQAVYRLKARLPQ